MEQSPRYPLIVSLRDLARAIAAASHVPIKPEDTLPWAAANEIIKLNEGPSLYVDPGDAAEMEIQRLRDELAKVTSSNILLRARLESIHEARQATLRRVAHEEGEDMGDLA